MKLPTDQSNDFRARQLYPQEDAGYFWGPSDYQPLVDSFGKVLVLSPPEPAMTDSPFQTRLLADVLWEAANQRLWSGREDYEDCNDGWCKFTCDALRVHGAAVKETAILFLERVGFPRYAEDRYDLFKEHEEGETRQGVRYLWLLLAACVAEDEGIEVTL